MRGLAALLAGYAVWTVSKRSVGRIRRPRLVTLTRSDIGWALGTAAATAAVTMGVTHVPAISIALGSVVGTAVLLGRRRSQQLSRIALQDAWPDFLAVVRSELAAGSPMPDATIAAANRIGGPLTDVARRMERDLRAGTSFADAVEASRQRLAEPMADRVLTALAVAAGAGGPRVAEILGLLGHSVADELRMRRAHDAAMTQQRVTAAVALVAPWGLLFLTVATNPQARLAYETHAGFKVIAVGLALTAIGFVAARRTLRLGESKRIFG